MQKLIFKAANGARFSDKAARVYGARINELAKKTGSVTPPIVLDDARDSKSPLHDYFEWNNTKAAEKWRLEQAAYLIRGITVTVLNDGKKEDIRYFFSVASEDEESSPIYVTLGTVMTNAGKRAEVIAYAKRELRGWTARYRQYSELREIVKFIKSHA